MSAFVQMMSDIQECRFELDQHLPYSPDLAPTDYHLFLYMETALSGNQVMMMSSLLWLTFWRHKVLTSTKHLSA